MSTDTAISTTYVHEQAIKAAKAQMLLMFLKTNEEEHAHRLGFQVSDLIPVDAKGTVTIVDQKVTVTLEIGTITITFTSQDKYDYHTIVLPGVKGVSGVFYRRDANVPKPGLATDFYITQNPSFFGESGRIVIDFWKDNQIIGVFKTNSSNFGAGGLGAWQAGAKN